MENMKVELVKSALNRVRAAITRRSEQARVADEERQQRAADEQVIGQTKTHMALISRQHGMIQDEIWQLDRDVHVAKENVRTWTESIARQEIRLQTCKADIAPLQKELAKLRELLNGVE
jgi:chromosome segregation ATPase